MKTNTIIQAAALFFVAHSLAAQDSTMTLPQVMISNLNQLWPYPTMGNFETVLPGAGYGFMFATGATPYTLNQVVFQEVGGPGTVQFSVYAIQGDPNEGRNPNMTLAGGLGYASLDPRPTQWPGYTSFVDYTPFTSIALEPNTFYLIAATEPANGDDNTALTFNYNYSYSVAGDWSVDKADTAWSYHSDDPISPAYGWTVDDSPGSIMIEVDATPVPEPSVSGMLGVCTFMLWSFVRRHPRHC